MIMKGSKFHVPGYGFRVPGSAFAWAFVVCAAVLTLPAVRFEHGVVDAQAPALNFAETVYPIFEKAGCRSCHSDEGVASGTRLHFPPEGAPVDEVEAFGLTLAALVDREDPSRSLLLNKPTSRVRHVGGTK